MKRYLIQLNGGDDGYDIEADSWQEAVQTMIMIASMRNEASKSVTDVFVSCEMCDGSGNQPGYLLNIDCEICNGTGWIPVESEDE